jgi:two-component system phosphate regulon sensor histidine kinase PhoR
MRQDLWKFGLLLAVAGLVGLLSGYFLQALLLASLGVVAWLMIRLELLYRWVLNPNNEPLPEQNGQIYKLHKQLHRRFADSRRRKRQLANYLSQFRKAASVIPEAIIMLDEMGKIEWANLNASQLFGIQWPRDAGVRFIDLVREPDVGNLLSQSSSHLHGIQISLPTSRQQTVSMKCVRYTESLRMIIAGDVSGLLAFNRLQADFVANVSHELKTPLTVLRGYLEILSDHPKLDGALVKPVQQMSHQSERMHLIVNDLLYLAKLEDKGNSSEHKLVEITELINAIIESIQPVVDAKQHKIRLDIDHSTNLIGNRSELYSAISNLITNAVNYSQQNGQISITWERHANGATLLVKDSGSGIPASAIPNLTKRFYRVDNDRSRQSGGTGLGLAIVKHVLQRHNAKLEIDSLIGVGSEFRSVFPQAQLSLSSTKQKASN